MPKRITILHAEDDPLDADLVRETLASQGVHTNIFRVETEDEFRRMLEDKNLSLILADYALPAFDGMTALRLAREIRPGLPFIFVSGSNDEELAVESLKSGATDYVLKHRLHRLPLSVRKALSDASEHRLRMEAELALRESEERYRLLFESNPLPMWVYDIETLVFLAVNHAAIQLYGYSRKEFLAMTIKDIRPKEDVPALVDAVKNAPNGLNFTRAWSHRKKDGTVIYVDITAHTLTFAGRKAELVLANDITERKRAEVAQRTSQQQYESLVHSIDGIVWKMDVETFRFTFVSRQAERLLGYTSEQWVAEPDFWSNHLHPDDRRWVVDFCKEETARQADYQFDYRMIAADGRVVWLRDFVTVDARNPEQLMLQGVMVDITAHKRAEAEREIIFEVIEGVYTTRNLDELLKLIHRSLSKLLYAENCFVALHDPTTDLMHYEFWVDQLDPVPHAHAPRHGFSSYVLRTNQPLLLTKDLRRQMYESREVEKVGSQSASWLGVPLRTPERVIGVLVTQHYEDDNAYSKRDLEFLNTVGDQIALAIERKRAEQERAQLTAQVEQQRLRLNTIIANVPGVVWEAWREPDDATQQINFVSDYVETLLGYSVEEWLRTPNFWLTIVHPEDRDRAAQVSAAHFASGESYTQEFRWVAVDGHIVWVETQASVIRDKQGKPAGMRGVNLDITERKQAEEALLLSEEQLRQSQKLEAVGQLAGGIAHDFNNLLTVITGYSDLALRRLDKDNPLRSGIEEIKKASERAASLTRQLLAFSRKQVLKPKVLKLNAIVADVDKMLRRLIGEDVDLVVSLDPALGQIKADPGQIEQVIINLAVNARDAMPQGGKLTIETSNVYLDNNYARNHVAIQPGQYVMLAISDTGCGMDTETQARMFEPFFTTKESGKGTGLGLSTVYGIVKQSDGSVWAYSEEGKGTTFKIYLPCVDESVATDRTSDTTAFQTHGLEMILLAEDEDQVRLMTRGILEMNGYRVIDATNGVEALSMYELHESQIDLVLTDAVMPRMGGRELSESLRVLSPEIKVLYMSGYTGDAIVRHGLLDQRIAFLQKPFTPDALLRKVRETLDGPHAD